MRCVISRAILLSVCVFTFALPLFAKDDDRETAKERDEALLKNLETFVVNSAETDRNYTTLSIRNWKSSTGRSVAWSAEEIIRKMLDAFERKHPQLEVYSITTFYSSKSGGGIECTGILIQHGPPKKRSLLSGR